MTLIDAAFAPLHRVRIFTRLDLRNTNDLVRIQRGDDWKTVFNTLLGHFECLVMLFRLTNAPAVFQALVKDVLRNMLIKFLFVYIDDILIFSEAKEEYMQHVCLVLLENSVFVKAKKCEFHVTFASFLDFIVQQGRLSPAKIQAVVKWPNPSTRKQHQRFLSFVNFYRCFVQNYRRVAAPLTKLTSSLSPFTWTEEGRVRAFRQLKVLFITAPVLIHPDHGRQFVVEVDALDTGVGAVLCKDF